jgi:hypothetical protein
LFASGAPRRRAVQRVHLGALAREVDGLGDRELHAERELGLRDARRGLRIAVGGEVLGVQRVAGPQHTFAAFTIEARRILQVEHRLARRAQLDALVHRRQEAGAPQRLAGARQRAAAQHGDERRQIAVRTAEPVRHPRAERRPPRPRRAGEQQVLGRCVVELVRDHRPHERDVAELLRGVREELAHVDARGRAQPAVPVT